MTYATVKVHWPPSLEYNLHNKDQVLIPATDCSKHDETMHVKIIRSTLTGGSGRMNCTKSLKDYS